MHTYVFNFQTYMLPFYFQFYADVFCRTQENYGRDLTLRPPEKQSYRLLVASDMRHQNGQKCLYPFI